MFKLLTDDVTENVKFLDKAVEWVKVNPVLTGTIIAVGLLAIAVVLLNNRKQNKKRKK